MTQENVHFGRATEASGKRPNTLDDATACPASTAQQLEIEAREAFEVVVKRPQRGAMLNRQRGQMRIRSEIACRAAC